MGCCNQDCVQGRTCPSRKSMSILQRLKSLFTKDERVLVFKNGFACGWYKQAEAGKNAIIAACKTHGFNIEDYEFRDYKTGKKVLWKGTRADLGV